jgi:hypothetical protein
MRKEYYLVDTRTGKAALKSEDRSFLEGMMNAMMYPNWVVTENVAENGLQSVSSHLSGESDDVPELSVTESLPDEYWHSMNKD